MVQRFFRDPHATLATPLLLVLLFSVASGAAATATRPWGQVLQR